jgi:hypothetical protein
MLHSKVNDGLFLYYRENFEGGSSMYKKVDGSSVMTLHEASELYPDSHILLQMNEAYMINPAGVVLYIGDDYSELFALQVDLPVPHGIVFEGINIQRKYSLGGIVVGK